MTNDSRKRQDYQSLIRQYADPRSLMFKKLRLVDSCITGGRNLLDFGVGIGELINLERQKFSNIFGIDSDKRSISICEDRFEKDKNIRVCQNNGSDLVSAFSDTRFDCITACDVLEHVQLDERERLLRIFYSLLDVGGKFIFTGPGIFEKVRIRFGRSPTHVQSHSSDGWSRLIRIAGSQLISVESVEFPLTHTTVRRKRYTFSTNLRHNSRKGRSSK
jgi:cyclopropane fatty-acyl-phospholipid synthase-like methyltransferase